MPGIRFVCDSTADLDPEYYREHNIRVVPLKVNFGDESLVDGVEIDAATFYARMRAADRNPTTSQPTPAEFEAAFRTAAAGGDTVVCTTLSAEMSGTHAAALRARDAVPHLDVRVIDTRSVSIGHGVLLEEAVAAAEAGAGPDAVVQLLDDLIHRQRVLFTVPTLEYLRRGGRIGGAAALLGSVLHIRPVLTILDGRIEPHDRVRTYQRALERIAAEVVAAVGESGRRARAAIGHADRPDDALWLAERIAPHCEQPPRIGVIGPIVGCHAGPGALGIAFHIRPR